MYRTFNTAPLNSILRVGIQYCRSLKYSVPYSNNEVLVVISSTPDEMLQELSRHLTEVGKVAITEIHPIVIKALVTWCGFDHIISSQPRETKFNRFEFKENSDEDNDDYFRDSEHDYAEHDH